MSLRPWHAVVALALVASVAVGVEVVRAFQETAEALSGGGVVAGEVQVTEAVDVVDEDGRTRASHDGRRSRPAPTPRPTPARSAGGPPVDAVEETGDVRETDPPGRTGPRKRRRRAPGVEGNPRKMKLSPVDLLDRAAKRKAWRQSATREEIRAKRQEIRAKRQELTPREKDLLLRRKARRERIHEAVRDGLDPREVDLGGEPLER